MEKTVKAIELQYQNWFELKNQWLTSVSVYSSAFIRKIAETEKAVQLKINDTQTKKEYTFWAPKSAILNLEIL